MGLFRQPSPEHLPTSTSPEVLEQIVAKLTVENQELQERNKQLEEIAMKDVLTGAWNRRGISETMPYLFPANREGLDGVDRNSDNEHHSANAVLFIDIDNFKVVNDLYGHASGDMVLQQTTAFLKNQVRATDMIGRWGGEEFVVIFRGAKAQDIVNKFYKKTDERPEVSFDTELKGEKLTITLSGGVTDLIPGETIEEAVGRADIGLYRAKEKGKNRIEKVAALQEIKR